MERVEDPVLRSALTTLLRLVEVIKDLVGKAGVYEEEDFQPTTYGFKLCAEVSEQRCLGMLREAEEELRDKEGSNSSKAAKTFCILCKLCSSKRPGASIPT